MEFGKFAEASGVRPSISPYCTRHAFCVAGLENGVGERQVADVLGHTSGRYVAWYSADVRDKAEYLRGIVDDVHRPRDRGENGKPGPKP